MSSEQDKRLKCLEENDRISTLPKDVICHILSLLPTKYAACTLVLSTFWKDILDSIPVLDFDYSLTNVPSEATELTFKCFILSILNRRNFSPIDKFRLICTQFSYDIKFITNCIAYLVYSKVKELQVEVLVNEFCSLPPLLFTLKTLTDLRLCGEFIINVPDFVYLPQLKILHLKELVFCNDDSVRHLFSYCPILEDLNMWCCKMGFISVLNISVSSLKKFMFYGNEGEYEIMLNAPNLEDMYYSAMAAHVLWQHSKYSLKSLVKASICLKQDFHVPELVNRICDVKFLTLSGGSVEALFGTNQPLPIFRNLTCLNLRPDHNSGWNFLPRLLANSPCLEVIIFDRGLHDHDGNFIEVAHYLSDPIPKCVSAQLKEVKVGYFHGEEYEFKMVEYFLKNAKVLKKIIISPSLPWYTGYEACQIFSTKDQFLMTKKLLKLQRGSRACRIVFTKELTL